MKKNLLNAADKKQLARVGKPAADVAHEYRSLCRGTRPVRLLAQATVANGGIVRIDAAALARRFDRVTAGKKLCKFVPASGAASRLFKLLHAARDKNPAELEPAEQKELERFWSGLRQRRFPFGPDLDRGLARQGLSVKKALARGQEDGLLALLLDKKGLGLAQRPKALLPFHCYGRDDVRLPLEEHLREAAVFSQGRVHFTISPEAEKECRKQVSRIIAKLRKIFPGVKFSAAFSFQDPATDSVALEADGSRRIFRNPDGSLLLRPAGHGSLLSNLQNLDADVVFVKNIDNVSSRPAWQAATLRWKKALAVHLLEKQQEIFRQLRRLEKKRDPRSRRLFQELNRPLRVAGMVKNTGEPGGGPFFVAVGKNQRSLQIVEHGEMDLKDRGQAALMKKAAYFSPTDLVLGIKDYKGRAFDLRKFQDQKRYFISRKSQAGRPGLVYERPGLWNGAMAGWINLFVETPRETFSPVKTINDLLRYEHQ